MLWSDVTILVGGGGAGEKRLLAHRKILSICSPVFAALLAEKDDDEDKDNLLLEITDIKPTIFETLLRFIYTGQVPPVLERQAATELLAAAKRYQLIELERCLIGRRVTNLPYLCLLALFRQMTLEDQLTARQVCRRWNAFVPDANLNRRSLTLLVGSSATKKFENYLDEVLFSRRQTLKLLLNADGSPLYPTRRLTCWNSLHVGKLYQLHFSKALVKDIATTFTGINKLQVILCVLSTTVDNLAYLLEQWPAQLTTLQLFEDHIYDIDTQSIARLCAAIKAQSTLKHLHLNLCNLSGLSLLDQLPIGPALEELHFCSNSMQLQKFLQMLSKNGGHLTRIEYQDHQHVESHLEQLNEHSDLCRRFTRLAFSNFSPIHDPTRISVHFSSLTSLCFRPSGITTIDLFTLLTNLPQLIHLYLIIDKYFTLADSILLPRWKVSSARALELELLGTISIHQELAKLQLDRIMPNVEVLRFELSDFKCNECQSRPTKRCLRQLFTLLKPKCSKLRLIEHSHEDHLGTVEELLASKGD